MKYYMPDPFCHFLTKFFGLGWQGWGGREGQNMAKSALRAINTMQKYCLRSPPEAPNGSRTPAKIIHTY